MSAHFCRQAGKERLNLRATQGWNMRKVSVLLSPAEEDRFSAYCSERGFKKSTLIARLIREHLDGENYAPQPALFEEKTKYTPKSDAVDPRASRK
jgi:hypothetical protein